MEFQRKPISKCFLPCPIIIQAEVSNCNNLILRKRREARVELGQFNVVFSKQHEGFTLLNSIHNLF